ncbi:hypothetical protein CPLU01_02332 [Colletotrichum plurivorum]|uniref:Uncharacterized protein n=1 Tax=Colletotrichum plurivorum TaxID=2175906 RepID=A0A8H6NN44_9PEZI|nr:hypothetical protein CPLU01_02332 [Colletotrichum plurivorum]
MVAHDVQPIWTGGDGRQRTTDKICKCIVARGVAAAGGLTYTSFIPAKRLQTGPDQVQYRAGRAASGVAGGGVTFDMTLSQLSYDSNAGNTPKPLLENSKLSPSLTRPKFRVQAFADGQTCVGYSVRAPTNVTAIEKDYAVRMQPLEPYMLAPLVCMQNGELWRCEKGQNDCSRVHSVLWGLGPPLEQWGRNTNAVTTAAASDFDSGATSAARNQVGASSRRKRTDTDALCSTLQIGAGTGLQDDGPADQS